MVYVRVCTQWKSIAGVFHLLRPYSGRCSNMDVHRGWQIHARESRRRSSERKLLLCCFLIIKHVMGSILAEKDLACACCANFIASVLPYVTELQVLEVLKQCLLPDTGSPPVKWESKVWTLQEGGDLGVKCQDQISVLARLQGAVQRMSQPALPRWALHLPSPVTSLPASCRTWMIIWY